MRSRSRSIGAHALILSAVAALLAGCSSGGAQQSFTTSSLTQRPQEGMVRDEPRRYPDGSTSGGSYADGAYGRPYAQARRSYVDPGHPTPREFAAAHPDPAQRDYVASAGIQTASIGPGARTAPPHASHQSYDQQARWQQRPPSQWQQAAPLATGSTGPHAAPPHASHRPQIVEVREGDTLFGLSRRYNVPVGDLVAANRLPNDRIAIGQRLVIPTRYR